MKDTTVLILKIAGLFNTLINVQAAWYGTGMSFGAMAGEVGVAGTELGTVAAGTAGAVGTAGVATAAAVGPVLVAFTGLYSIGRAGQIGDNMAGRNAARTGFCRTIAALARRQNWYPSNALTREFEVIGKNHAIRLVRAIYPERRDVFLARWRPENGGFSRILQDIHGYEV